MLAVKPQPRDIEACGREELGEKRKHRTEVTEAAERGIMLEVKRLIGTPRSAGKNYGPPGEKGESRMKIPARCRNRVANCSWVWPSTSIPISFRSLIQRFVLPVSVSRRSAIGRGISFQGRMAPKTKILGVRFRPTRTPISEIDRGTRKGFPRGDQNK